MSQRSRRVRDKVKAARPQTLATAAKRIEEHLLPDPRFEPFFGDQVTLVPVPRSAPLPKGALWPSQQICQAIVARGLAAVTLPCVERIAAVPKSAFAKPGERPTAERHFETMAATAQLDEPATLVVVDDFVTKGSTILAAASHVAEAFPGSNVLAFALVRTKGLIPEIDAILEPCVGEITYEFGTVLREP